MLNQVNFQNLLNEYLNPVYDFDKKISSTRFFDLFYKFMSRIEFLTIFTLSGRENSQKIFFKRKMFFIYYTIEHMKA